MQTHKLMEVFVNNNGFHKTYFPGTGKLKTFPCSSRNRTIKIGMNI